MEYINLHVLRVTFFSFFKKSSIQLILIQQELFSTFTEKTILLVRLSYKSFSHNVKKNVVTLANNLLSEMCTFKDFIGNEWVRSCLLSEKTDLDHNT